MGPILLSHDNTMQHISSTPFGAHKLSPDVLAYTQMAEAPCPVQSVDKWAVFNDLRVAKDRFGVTDRDLSVLNALITFLPAREMLEDGELIVFPSNAKLSERAHGMAESTLRRHLAALVKAGLILRHDSPNGKRYATRGSGGMVIRAFGFSLRPLIVRSPEISESASEVRERARELHMTREQAVLSLRDATKYCDYLISIGSPAPLDGLQAELAQHRRALRRKLDLVAVREISESLKLLQKHLHAILSAEEMSANAEQNERHYQNSKTDIYESELDLEKPKKAAVDANLETDEDYPLPNMPLPLVLKACPDVLTFSRRAIRSWSEFVNATHDLLPMLGISQDAWREAVEVMGAETASICVAGILQRIKDIHSPGGYLRALTRKAENGAFSPGPMIMALLSSDNRQPV